LQAREGWADGKPDKTRHPSIVTLRRTLRTAWHWAVFSIGRCAAQVKLCRVWVGPDGGFQKRRKPLAELLVFPLNLALRCLGIGLEVLRGGDWLERERIILGSILGRPVSIKDAVLSTPRLPGCCLWRFSRDQANSAHLWPALEAAARALRALHDAGVEHSDAALHNALYDQQRDQVGWLDFETRYRAGRPRSWCQAHDLAAFLASAAKALPGRDLTMLVQVVSRGYGDHRRLVHAGELLARLPVLLIIETPWSLTSLDDLRELLAPKPPNSTPITEKTGAGYREF